MQYKTLREAQTLQNEKREQKMGQEREFAGGSTLYYRAVAETGNKTNLGDGFAISIAGANS